MISHFKRYLGLVLAALGGSAGASASNETWQRVEWPDKPVAFAMPCLGTSTFEEEMQPWGGIMACAHRGMLYFAQVGFGETSVNVSAVRDYDTMLDGARTDPHVHNFTESTIRGRRSYSVEVTEGRVGMMRVVDLAKNQPLVIWGMSLEERHYTPAEAEAAIEQARAFLETLEISS